MPKQEAWFEPPKIPHVHTNPCYVNHDTCHVGYEHSHNKGCEDRDGNQTCGRTQHSHTSSCTFRRLNCTKQWED